MRLSESDQEERHRAAEFMDYAASLIEEHGWLQGKRGSFAAGFCAMGSLDEAIRQARLSAFREDELTESGFDKTTLRWVRNIDAYAASDFRRSLLRNLTEWLIAEGEQSRSFHERSELGSVLAYSAIVWNDEPERRESDVVNALRKAAITLRESVSDLG